VETGLNYERHERHEKDVRACGFVGGDGGFFNIQHSTYNTQHSSGGRLTILDLRFWIGVLDDNPRKIKAIFPVLKAFLPSTILRVLRVIPAVGGSAFGGCG
jgi:hypothetical protein